MMFLNSADRVGYALFPARLLAVLRCARSAGSMNFYDSSWGLRPRLYAPVRFADSRDAFIQSDSASPLIKF